MPDILPPPRGSPRPQFRLGPNILLRINALRPPLLDQLLLQVLLELIFLPPSPSKKSEYENDYEPGEYEG